LSVAARPEVLRELVKVHPDTLTDSEWAEDVPKDVLSYDELGEMIMKDGADVDEDEDEDDDDTPLDLPRNEEELLQIYEQEKKFLGSTIHPKQVAGYQGLFFIPDAEFVQTAV